jgi:hypothetical protein
MKIKIHYRVHKPFFDYSHMSPPSRLRVCTVHSSVRLAAPSHHLQYPLINVIRTPIKTFVRFVRQSDSLSASQSELLVFVPSLSAFGSGVPHTHWHNTPAPPHPPPIPYFFETRPVEPLSTVSWTGASGFKLAAPPAPSQSCGKQMAARTLWQ